MNIKGKITKKELHESVLQLIEKAGSNNECSGSAKIVHKKSSTTIRTATNQVAINISGFDKNSDLLMVYKNSTYIEENEDYTISSDSLYIVNTNGNWNINNEEMTFNFVVIKTAPTSLGETRELITSTVNIKSSEWLFSAEDELYYKDITHNLGTEHLFISAMTTDTKDSIEVVVRYTNSNTIRVYNESNMDITMNLVSADSQNSVVVNQIDDSQINSNSTWSSSKINSEIFQINPDIFSGTDLEKLQKSFDLLISKKAKQIVLNRDYNITGGTIVINKEYNPRFTIRLEGQGNKLIKNDNGFMFTSNSEDIGDLYFKNITFQSIKNAGTKVYDCSKLIRIHSTNNLYNNIDYCFYEDGRYLQSIKTINDTFLFVKYVFKYSFAYDILVDNIICEESENFMIDDEVIDYNLSSKITITNSCIEGLTGTVFKTNGCYSLNISNNYFEVNNEYIKIGNNGVKGCSINSNFFFDNNQKTFISINGNDLFYSINDNYVDSDINNSIFIQNNGNNIIDINGTYTTNRIVISNKLNNLIKHELPKIENKGDYFIKYNNNIEQFHLKKSITIQGNSDGTLVFNNNNYIKLDDIVSATIVKSSASWAIQVKSVAISTEEVVVTLHNSYGDIVNVEVLLNVLKMKNIGSIY